MNQLIGQFAVTTIDFGWRDGLTDISCQIAEFANNKFCVRTKTGHQYWVETSSIKKLIAPPTPRYAIGTVVEAVTDYHWKDGEMTDFVQILSVTVFCTDIDYAVKIIKSGKTMTLSESQIKKIVALKVARYANGSYIGVKHSNGHPYYYDETIKNGRITTVTPWYDRVTYTVTYDDGTVETVEEYSITHPSREKSEEQKQQEYQAYLRSEEQRLLQQLAYIRNNPNYKP